MFLVAALASVVVRYLRSEGVRRQQIKWLMFATLMAVVLTVSEDLLGFVPDSGVPFAVAIALFPVAIAIAIFRYRLYDIDVIINRALVYGALTVSLALIYVGIIVVLQRLFTVLTGQEKLPQLAIVASTLAIAPLLNLLRRRVQNFIDHLFYRRKYDAAKTLEAFSANLRDEIDLEQLHANLERVVRETVQPAHVSLWLRPEAGPKSEL